MNEFRQVFDPESINQCDRCGVTIAKGTLYYAKEDDKEILCVLCMSEESIKTWKENEG